MLAAVACGLFVGALITSAAWVSATQRTANRSGEIVVLLEDGFENAPAPACIGIPTNPNGWAGDFCELVGEQQQVRPAAASALLLSLKQQGHSW